MTTQMMTLQNSLTEELAQPGERDGLEENIVLLRELSKHLEQYFAMQTMGEAHGET